jgi:hypothetical protein
MNIVAVQMSKKKKKSIIFCFVKNKTSAFAINYSPLHTHAHTKHTNPNPKRANGVGFERKANEQQVVSKQTNIPHPNRELITKPPSETLNVT